MTIRDAVFSMGLIAAFALLVVWIVRSEINMYRKHGLWWLVTSAVVWLWPL